MESYKYQSALDFLRMSPWVRGRRGQVSSESKAEMRDALGTSLRRLKEAKRRAPSLSLFWPYRSISSFNLLD